MRPDTETILARARIAGDPLLRRAIERAIDVLPFYDSSLVANFVRAEVCKSTAFELTDVGRTMLDGILRDTDEPAAAIDAKMIRLRADALTDAYTLATVRYALDETTPGATLEELRADILRRAERYDRGPALAAMINGITREQEDSPEPEPDTFTRAVLDFLRTQGPHTAAAISRTMLTASRPTVDVAIAHLVAHDWLTDARYGGAAPTWRALTRRGRQTVLARRAYARVLADYVPDGHGVEHYIAALVTLPERDRYRIADAAAAFERTSGINDDNTIARDDDEGKASP